MCMRVRMALSRTGARSLMLLQTPPASMRPGFLTWGRVQQWQGARALARPGLLRSRPRCCLPPNAIIPLFYQYARGLPTPLPSQFRQGI